MGPGVTWPSSRRRLHQLTASSLSLKVLGAFKEEEVQRAGPPVITHLPLSQMGKTGHRMVTSLAEIAQLSGAAGTLAPEQLAGLCKPSDSQGQDLGGQVWAWEVTVC